MFSEEAKKYYLGKKGYGRMNCAQSVICAFKEKYELSKSLIDMFSSYGGGNSPQGLCGAFYAVMFIIEKNGLQNLSDFEKYFSKYAGSTKCCEIRNMKRLSCIGCIEKSCNFLEENGT